MVQSNDVTEKLNHIKTIETQIKKLRNIAWTQSHEVRGPLSRILGLINLIEEHKDSFDDILFFSKSLKDSSNEMDEIIRKIVNETNHLDQD